MIKVIKVIFVFLFAMLLHSVANDYFTGQTVEEDTHATLTFSTFAPQTTIDAVQLPYFPDAELAGTGIQLHQVAMARILRINAAEYLLSLKNMSQKLIECEAALVQHWGKIYDTTTSYYCYPVSEYYVFALRRIIV